jgi:hypothetical protein
MVEDSGMINSFDPIFTITNRIAAALTSIERARGFLEAATLSDFGSGSPPHHTY